MNRTIIDEMEYVIFSTNEITSELREQYVMVHRNVFNSCFSVQDFIIKFENNIFGCSIHVIVYYNGSPCAIRSLWRNDCNEKVCFQPCDTAVLESARGRGVFGKMTKLAIEYIKEPEYVIYNFPNDNSRKLYLKNGWQIRTVFHISPFWGNKFYNAYSDRIIPDDYFSWYLLPYRDYLSIKRIGNSYYLVKNKGKIACVIIGKLTEKIGRSGYLKESKRFVLFFRSHAKTILPIRPLYVVTTSNSEEYFDFWRIDSFI